MDLLEEMFSIIARIYGNAMAMEFVDLQKTVLGGRELDMSNLSPADQIKEMNNFWRKVLNKHSDTTEIKSWLCEGGDIQAYLFAFEHSWLPLIVNARIL